MYTPLFLLEATATTATSPSASKTITSTTQVAQQPLTQAHKQQSPWGSVGLIIAMFAIFYFLLIRPNQKKEKERRSQLSQLTEGDKVITSGGIKGTILNVKEDTITIDSKGTKIELVKLAVVKVIK